MKRPLTLIAAATLVSTSAVAQGQVQFSNFGAPITNSLTGMPLPTGNVFSAALYFLPDQAIAPTTADFDMHGLILDPPATNFLVAGVGGVFNAGRRTTPSPEASHAWFQVRAWETAFGTSYEAAIHNTQPQGGRLALAGTSNIIYVGPLGPEPIGVPYLVYGGLKGFVLVPVPEPSVIGMGMLGIVALFLLRRRK
jgi:hypothetical protein